VGGTSALIRSVLFGTAVAGSALLFGGISPWSRGVVLILCVLSATPLTTAHALERGTTRTLAVPMLLLVLFLALRSFAPPVLRHVSLASLSVLSLSVCIFLACMKVPRAMVVVSRAAGVVVWFALALLITGGRGAVDWWFHNRNILALYVLMTGLLCAGVAKSADGVPDWFACSVVAIAGVVLVFLRAYAAGVAFGTVIAFMLLTNTLRVSPVIPAVFFLAGSVWASVMFPVSFLDRVVWTWTALRIWCRHLLVGVGPGMFGFYYPAFSAGLPAAETATAFVHNLYASIAAETGVWGMLFTAAAAYAVWKSVVWRRRESAAAGYAVAGALLCSVADFSLQVPMNAVLFAALIAGATAEGAPEVRRGNAAREFATGVLFVCAIVGVLCSVRLAVIERALPDRVFRSAAVVHARSGDRSTALSLLRRASHYNPRDAETYAVAATLLSPPDRFAMLRTAILLNPRAARRYARMVQESP